MPGFELVKPGFWVLVGLMAVASYFFGCFNGAVIVSKYILRDDVRGHGSGNAGLTNFYRTFGGPLTFVVILCDVLKTVFSALLGAAVFGMLGEPLLTLCGKLLAGLFCMIGHMFPCMFHFKGGKSVLCGGVIAIMADWRVALVVWGGFLILAALTRYVSLGSIYAGTAFPFATWFVFHAVAPAVLSALCGALLVWGHRANIRRLLHGNESRFSFHHKTEGRQ